MKRPTKDELILRTVRHLKDDYVFGVGDVCGSLFVKRDIEELSDEDGYTYCWRKLTFDGPFATRLKNMFEEYGYAITPRDVSKLYFNLKFDALTVSSAQWATCICVEELAAGVAR